MLEHTIRLHMRKTIYLNLSPYTCTFFRFYRLAWYILSCQIVILFSLENDDMESLKCRVKLFSLIFIIRCLTKPNLIQIWLQTT